MTIKFNKNFYNLGAAKKSVTAYKKLADFSIKEKRDSIEVTIKNIDKDFKGVLYDEFSNYVLAEMKR